jgi:hypothetical protein
VATIFLKFEFFLRKIAKSIVYTRFRREYLIRLVNKINSAFQYTLF